MRRSLVAPTLAALIAVPTVALPGVAPRARRADAVPAPRASLPDFDVRAKAFDAAAAAPGAVAPAKRARAAAAFGAAEVRPSALTGAARNVVPIRGPLAGAATGSPADVALAFLRDRADAFGLTETDIAGLRLVREYRTADLGVTHLTFAQEAGGVRVVGADFRAAVDGGGRVVWAGGEVIPAAERLAKASAQTMDAAAAAAAAAASIGAAAEPRLLESKGGAGEESLVELGVAFTEPAVARRTAFPLAPGVVRPAWTVLLAERGPGNLYVVTLDAEKGAVLARHNLTRYLGQGRDAAFRVFTRDSPQPNLPFGSPAPTAVDRELVAVPLAQVSAASRDGWVGDAGASTGNNVNAVEDKDGNNFGGARATGLAGSGGALTFEPALGFPINNTQDNTDAAIVNLFYWCNYVHDYLYALGFDEAAGNFQAVNFSGEGRGGDPVNADARDGSGENNANFSTPPDGRAPRMQMFLWRGGYDGDFDTSVIIHEYAHGLSTRLIGGPDYVDGLTGPQSGGMGEGWSDWYALTMLARPEDPLDAPYVVGGYVTRDFRSGVRHLPYSTDMTVNDLTFEDIDPATSDAFDDPTEVHAIGEVWCSTLWELRANLIGAYGFAAGKALAERLVTDGMKFTINNPSFTDARDGILVADQVRTGGENQCLIWRAFAKRGVGYSAFTLNGSSTAVREAFDLPPWCESEGRPSLDRAAYDETDGVARLRIGDADLASASTVSATFSSSSGDSEQVTLAGVPNVPGLFELGVPLARAAAAPGDGRLQAAVGDTVTLSYEDATSRTSRTATALVVRRVEMLSDTAEADSGVWAAKGGFALTTEAAASPSHSWTDTPGANYVGEHVYSLTLKRPLDLSGAKGSRLVFKHMFATEAGYDMCVVEAKAKGSRGWQTLAVFSGVQGDFAPVTVDLSQFDGKQKLKLRFSLVTDQLVVSDGWYLDDIQVVTGRPQ